MIIENEIILIAESEKAKNMISNMQIEVNQSFSTLDLIMLNNNKTVTDFVSIIGRYLSKIEFLQKYLVNGIFDLQSLFYYVLVIFISLFLTSPASVKKARSTIFASIFINIMLERFVLNLLVDTIYETDIISYRSLLRSLLLVVIIVEFIAHLLTYNDLDEKSYVVLADLNEKLSGNKHENVKEEGKEKQNQNQNNNSYVKTIFNFIPVFVNNIKERYSNSDIQQSSISEIEENDNENENITENNLKSSKLAYNTPYRRKRGRSSAPGTLQSTAKPNGSSGSGRRGKSRKRRRTDSLSAKKRGRSSTRSVSKENRKISFDGICDDEEDIFIPKYKSPPNGHRMFNRN